MGEFEVTEKAEFVITPERERRVREHAMRECRESGDEFNEEEFQEIIAKIAAKYTAELQALAKFHDDEIARLKDQFYGLESEEPEPTVN